MANSDDFEDLQAKLRASGAQQLDRHTFRTNEGIAILASPADIKREKIAQRAMKNVNRAEKWSMGPTIAGAEPLIGEPDDEN